MHGGVEACVRNTFLDFLEEKDIDEDAWVMNLDPRRLHTDSVVALAESRRDRRMFTVEVDKHGHAGCSSGTPVTGTLRHDDTSSTDTCPGTASASEVPIGLVEDGQSIPPFPGYMMAPEVPGHHGQAFQGYINDGVYATGIWQLPFAHANSEEAAPKSSKEIDPKVLAAREVAAAGNGLSGLTTVMVRNVPSKYSQQKLMREINNMGFLGKYDFFYLPVQPHGRGNRGFAFINLLSAEIAEDFYCRLHGKMLHQFSSETPVVVMPADLQGFDNNAEHYANMRFSRSARRPLQSGRALFFRPLPAHLSEAVGSAAKVVEGGYPTIEYASHYDECSFGTHADVGVRGSTRFQTEPGVVDKKPVQQKEAAVQKFCAYCGASKPASHVFCTLCGMKAPQILSSSKPEN
mmetsp:Transcript_6363/g.11629  ORF Transcript_6363/g.11629 Transcript_6363/m.11629 type:complete len:404 (+) Transcript_6363:76-1287(+)